MTIKAEGFAMSGTQGANSALRLLGAMAAIGLVLGCTRALDDQPALPAVQCKVSDPDLAQQYQGACHNGQAEGKGVARGRDRYEGEFAAGDPHGWGIYEWGATSEWAGQRYEGYFNHGERTGFGVLSVLAEGRNPNYEFVYQSGTRVGDRYSVQGLFFMGKKVSSCEDDYYYFLHGLDLDLCKSVANVKFYNGITAIFIKREAARALAEKVAHDIGINSINVGELARAIPSEAVRQLGAAAPKLEVIHECTVDLIANRLTSGSGEYIEISHERGPPGGEIDGNRVVLRCLLEAIARPADIKELTGDNRALARKMLVIEGYGVLKSGALFLRSEPTDSSSLTVEINTLQREMRIEIERGCGDITKMCRVRAVGGKREGLAHDAFFAFWAELLPP